MLVGMNNDSVFGKKCRLFHLRKYLYQTLVNLHDIPPNLVYHNRKFEKHYSCYFDIG